MPEYLNPALFGFLLQRFGRVRVANAGQVRRVTLVPDPGHPGRLKEQVSEWGEQYCVDCPACGDTRGRLAVSYVYGTFDHTRGRVNDWTCYCQNERCHQAPDRRAVIRARLAIPLNRRARQPMPPRQSSVDRDLPTPYAETTLPENSIPINQLPEGHPAVCYLRGRRFDPTQLWNHWHVFYCESSPASHPAIFQRLVIPVLWPRHIFRSEESPAHAELIVAGWQARPIDDEREPKYVNSGGMKKSKLLYGLPFLPENSTPVFLCEGVTDAWRVGYGGLSLLGNTMSTAQRTLLQRFARGRPIVVLPDPGARAEAESVAEELRKALACGYGNNPVVVAELPPACDPADCTRQQLAVAAAAALGLNVADLGLQLEEVCP